MGLIAPWFLAGLTLLGLPLWLHLLKRHKAITQQFSSLMFFERSRDSSLKHRRLDYLLLLALRLALLALAVFAFTRPFLHSSAAAGGDASLRLLVLDRSVSMGAGDRMERARKEAAGVLSSIPARTKVQVAALDTQVHFLTKPSEDHAEARAAIEAMRAGDLASSYGALARSLRALATAGVESMEVHLFSDLQKSSMPPAFADLRLTAGTRLVLHPAAEKDESNWTVESVSAPAVVREGKGVRIRATVASFHAPESSRSVSLEINGRKSQTVTVAVPAGGRAVAEFQSPELPYGIARCAVVLETADALAADNRFQFPIERSDPDRVVFAYGERSQMSATFFENALEAAGGKLYTIEKVPAAQLSARHIEGRAFAVISDAVLPDQGEATLKSYVSLGGSALIVLGPSNVAAGRVPLTGEPIRGTRYAARDGERFFSVRTADQAHPVLRAAGLWEGVRFYQVADVQAKNSRAIAQLTDGSAILNAGTMGEGRFLVLASTLDNISNNLAVEPAFVAFAGESARWLSRHEDAVSLASTGASIELGSAAGKKATEVTGPDGKLALTLGESVRGAPLILDRAGFWELRAGGGRLEVIAANPDRRESDLERMPADSAALWQAPAAAAPAGTAAPVAPSRNDLSYWLLALALAVGAGEVFIASRHLERESA